ncbi:hypothetical protein STCU_01419 [Strigomonas culicis]|uniref:Uncharacterized protein n=1 Tax=Strigomonas culicis TaxID=28005 RepID=S9V106_9TRYP|nr:hypothetical protein STCU_01419 [Strigomonas culicis]|eukprot:EPY34683.1 hypothetical protein STCU_01419 [Strigomonas culicis]
METLAEPLRFADNILKSTKGSAPAAAELRRVRHWITHHFQGASFALINSTPGNAYYGFDYVAPEGQRQSMVYKVFGSAALYLLATLKIKPKVQHLAPDPRAAADTNQNNNNNNNNNTNNKNVVASGGDISGVEEAKDVMRRYFEVHAAPGTAAARYPADPKAWLRTEIDVFLSLRPPRAAASQPRRQAAEPQEPPALADFHGGDAPDLADIEMYGVTRVVAAHPVFGPVLRSCAPFRAWEEKMESYMQPL